MVQDLPAPFFFYTMPKIVKISPVYRYYELELTEEQKKIYEETPNKFLIDIVKDEDWVYIESIVGADEYELKK